MSAIWDYDIKQPKKTKRGRLLIPERMTDYGLDAVRLNLDFTSNTVPATIN